MEQKKIYFSGDVHMAAIRKLLICLFIGMVLFLAAFWYVNKSPYDPRPQYYFAGGPQGSTAQNIAAEIVALLNKDMPDVHFRLSQSSGSKDNLNRLEAGKLHFAVAGAEDSYYHSQPRAMEGAHPRSKVLMLVRLFGDYAHLLVSSSSPYQTPTDLRGKRIAIGGSGSDSANVAKRYFHTLGLWGQITPIYVGYDLALDELFNGTVEAAWLLAGLPNEMIHHANKRQSLRNLSAWQGFPITTEFGEKFFKTYPFYEISTISPHTYQGQTEQIFSIGIASLLLASASLPDDLIYRVLENLYREKNLNKIRAKYPATKEIDLNNTLTRFYVPMHPGAVRFLRDQAQDENFP